MSRHKMSTSIQFYTLEYNNTNQYMANPPFGYGGNLSSNFALPPTISRNQIHNTSQTIPSSKYIEPQFLKLGKHRNIDNPSPYLDPNLVSV